MEIVFISNDTKEKFIAVLLKGKTITKTDEQSDKVILSDLENFEHNLKFIEECIVGKKLGKVPMLIGEYNNGIGIAEEYYNRLNSPTKIKLTLIKSAIKKYLCDHKDEVSEQLSDDEKKEKQIIERIKLVFSEPFRIESFKLSLSVRLSSLSCPENATTVEDAIDIIEYSLQSIADKEAGELIKADKYLSDFINRNNLSNEFVIPSTICFLLKKQSLGSSPLFIIFVDIIFNIFVIILTKFD